MNDNIDSRVKREAEAFDNQVLQRDRLARIMAHAKAKSGPARARRTRYIHNIIQEFGKGTILEIGSEAWAPMIFHNGVRPESLTCINISKTALDTGESQARKEGLNYEFKVMDAHHLEFNDATFDLIYGQAILHHLDMPKAMREFHRVLKPGGKMVFVEPLGFNPVAGVVRLLTPNARTDDERPLDMRDFREIDRYFEYEKYCTELFYVPAAVISGLLFQRPDNAFLRATDKFDEMLTKLLPFMGLMCRTVTIYGSSRREL